MLKHTHMNIYHAQMQSSFRHSGNIIHLGQHSFNRFIIFINIIYSCRSKMDRSLILWKLRSATSYIAATFHPTIGQCAHQSLSNTSMPELGMIPTRIKEH